MGQPRFAIPSQRADTSRTDGQGRIRTSVARKERQIYSLLPLTTRPPVRYTGGELPLPKGAGEGARTPDLLITNQLLYQLSYASIDKTLTLTQGLRSFNHPLTISCLRSSYLPLT